MCKACRATPAAKSLMAELTEIAQEARSLGVNLTKSPATEPLIKTPSNHQSERHRRLYRRLERVRAGLDQIHKEWKETRS